MTAWRVISIGTLDAHPLWGEGHDVRTGHATTTLISVNGANVLVDPGLPAQALVARLGERAPVTPEDVTHVFLTSFEPDHRRGLAAFEHAEWLLHEPERDIAQATLAVRIDEADGDAELVAYYESELAILERCRVADDRLANGVDLFPLPGKTPGTCGLLLPLPRATILVCGDAVATSEHLEQGKVLPDCADVEQAMESFREAVEIGDVLVPGRDNVLANPLRMSGTSFKL